MAVYVTRHERNYLAIGNANFFYTNVSSLHFSSARGPARGAVVTRSHNPEGLGINLIIVRLVRLVIPTLINRGEETYRDI